MTSSASLAESLAASGRMAIPFVDKQGNPDRPITLHCYRSAQYTPDHPTIIVLHGMLRNGDEYRDFWIPSADRYGLLIVAPTFSNEAYPKTEAYNNGLVYDTENRLRASASWSYASVPRIVRALQREGVTKRKQLYLYGHSAGGQFSHRMLSTIPDARDLFEAAFPSNAGWYSLPTLDLPFPEGLGGIGLTEKDLEQLLSFPLVILAGDQDIDITDPNLPAQEEAVRQGPHRFARAHNYLRSGIDAAQRLGIECKWRLQIVPGIGHDGAAMSAVAGSLWFDGKLPSSEGMKSLGGSHTA